MAPPQHISEEAKEIYAAFGVLYMLIHEEHFYMKPTTKRFLNLLAIDGVREINTMLRNPSVRVHSDPSIMSPKVHEGCSVNMYVQRLKHQVKAVCVLADSAHQGQEANAEEQIVILRTKDILDDIYNKVLLDMSQPDAITGQRVVEVF